MNSYIKKILEELYETDSTLKAHEKDLIKLIDHFQGLKKEVQISPEYKSLLKKELETRIRVYQNKQSFSYKNIFSTLFWGIALCSLLVFFYSDIYLSKNENKYQTPMNEEEVVIQDISLSNKKEQESISSSQELPPPSVKPNDKKPSFSSSTTHQKSENTEKTSTPLNPQKSLPENNKIQAVPHKAIESWNQNKIAMQDEQKKQKEESPLSPLRWQTTINSASSDIQSTNQFPLDPIATSLLLEDAGRSDLIDDEIQNKQNQEDSVSSDMSLKMLVPFSPETGGVAADSFDIGRSSKENFEQNPYIYKIIWERNSLFDRKIDGYWSLPLSLLSQQGYFIVSVSELTSYEFLPQEKNVLKIKLENDPIELSFWDNSSLHVIKWVVQNTEEDYLGPREIYFRLD